MRSFLVTLAGLAIGWTLTGCHFDIGDHVLSASEDFEETVTAGGIESSLTLTNVNGRVDVSSWDRSEFRIEAEKFATSKSRLDDIEIDVDETSSGVEVRTRFPKGKLFSNRGKVNFRITVPDTADVNVRTVNGKVYVSGIGGRLKAKTVNGSVEIEHARGEIIASTVNGNIEASFEALDARGHNEFATTNGSVRVGFPANAKGEFEARTVNGRIRSDFDELESSGRWGPKRLSGEIGSGGGSFEITTVNGSVRIEKTRAAIGSADTDTMAAHR